MNGPLIPGGDFQHNMPNSQGNGIGTLALKDLSN